MRNVRNARNVRNVLDLCAVWCGRSMLWTFFTIGRLLVGLVDVSSDWETFSVSQSFETSILISQSSKTSIQVPFFYSQSSKTSTATSFVLPIVENVHVSSPRVRF